MTNLSTLLTLADSRLPTGGHVHSGGVEEAVTSGLVANLETLRAYLRRQIRTHGLVTASLAMDNLIASTGVSYRALTNPSFMDNLLRQVESIKRQGLFSLPISGDLKQPSCATRDIAAVAARLLLDHSWSGVASRPVLGPEDLSYHDMARIMSEVLGTNRCVSSRSRARPSRPGCSRAACPRPWSRATSICGLPTTRGSTPPSRAPQSPPPPPASASGARTCCVRPSWSERHRDGKRERDD